jgi:hypothetical protein
LFRNCCSSELITLCLTFHIGETRSTLLDNALRVFPAHGR